MTWAVPSDEFAYYFTTLKWWHEFPIFFSSKSNLPGSIVIIKHPAYVPNRQYWKIKEKDMNKPTNGQNRNKAQKKCLSVGWMTRAVVQGDASTFQTSSVCKYQKEIEVLLCILGRAMDSDVINHRQWPEGNLCIRKFPELAKSFIPALHI